MNTFVEDLPINDVDPYAEESGFAGESQDAVASLAEESGVSNMAFAASSAVTETKQTTASTNQKTKED